MSVENVEQAAGAAQCPVTGQGGGACPVLPGYDPLSPEELKDPRPSYARAHREAPVFFHEQFGFWSVTRKEDMLAVIKDTKTFSNRSAIPMPLPPEELRDRMPVYPFATALLFLDDPEHRPARKMVQAPFTPKQLREMRPLIRERAESALRLQDPNRELEFVGDYAMPMALVVIGEIIGVPEQDFPMLTESIEGAFLIASGVASDEQIRDAAQGQADYWEYLHEIVEDRRRAPKNDFASVLSGFRDEEGNAPTSSEIAAHINTILGAGFETSAQMMTLGMNSMLTNRDQWEMLKADRSLLPRAIEECVRHRSVIKRNFRVANEDTEIGGVAIPKGALIAIMNGAANFDAEAYDDPAKFDITRKADNLAFGRGKHFCLGAPLSKLEMEVTLEVFMDFAPDARVMDQEITYRNDLRLDGMEALKLDLGPVPSDAPAPVGPAPRPSQRPRD